MNEQLISQLATQALAMAPHGNPHFPPSPYYRFLKRLAATMHTSLSVELGVCGGGGCLHLCEGWPAGIVAGVDKSNEYPDNIIYIQQRYLNFKFIRGDSVEVARKIYDEYGSVDILFIDTIHTYERTMEEYEAYRPFLAEGAVVCLDDLNRPGMDRAWADMPGRKVRLDILHPGGIEGGFGVAF